MIEKCAPIYCRGGAVGEPSYFIGKFVAMIFLKNDLLPSENFHRCDVYGIGRFNFLLWGQRIL
jgi:hypothetical protein